VHFNEPSSMHLLQRVVNELHSTQFQSASDHPNGSAQVVQYFSFLPVSVLNLVAVTVQDGANGG